MKRVILYLTCGLRNGSAGDFVACHLVGALGRRNCRDRRGFCAALASLQKRADGYRERESQKSTIVQQRLGPQALSGAEAPAIDFQPRSVGTNLRRKKAAISRQVTKAEYGRNT